MNAPGVEHGREEIGGGDRLDAQRHQVRIQLAERLEKQINLPAWLSAQGFHLSHIQSDPTKLAFEDRQGETIRLTKDLAAQRWTFETTREPIARGTAVDLMIRRDGLDFANCVERMAACLDPANRNREPTAYREAAAGVVLGRAVNRHVATMQAERDAERSLEALGVQRGTFDEWRFGPASAALEDFKVLGHSRYRPSDRALIIVERPIDAVAYERAHGHQQCAYIYVGDNPSDETKRKLAHVLADAPGELAVVAAVGRDRRGASLAEEIAELAGHRQVERRAPEIGSRWADQMQIEQRHRDSLQRLHRRPDPALEAVRHQIARALDAGVDQAAIRTAIVSRRRGLNR